MSDQIWYQKVIGSGDHVDGFWMCPTSNCDGAGFTFDIFPTDPDHPANQGWSDDDEGDEAIDGQADETWDPEEAKYAELEETEEQDDDLEGEEWKLGLEPGERPSEPEWAEEARRRWEEEQKKYDEPDLRPRELDWSDRPPPPPPGDNDIPF
jgi:hypothetical protein